MFITLEGGEGSGKSTILKKLEEYFLTQKRKVVVTREPGGGKISEDIRKIILSKNNEELTPKSEALLFAAARLQHLNDVIMPAKKAGKIVLCDRFFDSSLVYQGYASSLGEKYIRKIHDFMTKEYMPDITILLDIEPEAGLARIQKRGKDNLNRLDLKQLEYHKKVREAYHILAKKYKKRYIIVNSNRHEDDVFLDILDKLKEHKVFKEYEKSLRVF